MIAMVSSTCHSSPSNETESRPISICWDDSNKSARARVAISAAGRTSDASAKRLCSGTVGSVGETGRCGWRCSQREGHCASNHNTAVYARKTAQLSYTTPQSFDPCLDLDHV